MKTDPPTIGEGNTFQQTMVGLAYSTESERPADIFSRACVDSFSECDWHRYGYRFTQLFEPAVLHEAAILAKVPHDDLVDLRLRETTATQRLGAALDNQADLSFVERINLAS